MIRHAYQSPLAVARFGPLADSRIGRGFWPAPKPFRVEPLRGGESGALLLRRAHVRFHVGGEFRQRNRAVVIEIDVGNAAQAVEKRFGKVQCSVEDSLAADEVTQA